ncbi:sensor histidine kinase [Agromyces sp. CCNWLW203]|uniref:sensor histidine kinase n=1 Tax=Agromyces sp. CCNWLW203 TaxID=3112842 RepID=UPI002F96C3B3
MSRTSTAPAGPRPPLATALFARRTWKEFAFIWTALPVAMLELTYLSFAFLLGLLAALSYVGISIAEAFATGSRKLGTLSIRLARRQLGLEIADPPSSVTHASDADWSTRMRDLATSRTIGFPLLHLPLAVLSWSGSTIVLALGAGLSTEWLVQLVGPGQVQIFGYVADTPLMHVVFTVSGVLILLFVWPAVNRGLAGFHGNVIARMLGRTPAEERIMELTDSRRAAVTDADATLRRIERDLHDGTQARLVGLAMSLGDAHERLARGDDPATVVALVESARTAATSTLAELRDLAKGIHPPVLDAGLEAALASVAAGSPVPVELDCRIEGRPSAVVETIAYFSVLELLGNVVKHSGAGRAEVAVVQRGDRLVVTVADDGRGGAHVGFRDESGSGTGLAGLTGRARSVDGSLTVESPDGGPTRVTIDLPMVVA